MGMPILHVRDVPDEDHEAFIAEAQRRSKAQRRHVSISEVVRAELSKSAQRFRRKGKR
jgi:hypothetical protein